MADEPETKDPLQNLPVLVFTAVAVILAVILATRNLNKNEGDKEAPKPKNKKHVLNKDIPCPNGDCGKNSLDISRKVNKAMLGLQANYMDDQGNVDYKGIKTSEDFQEYRKTTGMLKKIDLSSLEDREMKALCLNLYNCLMIHATVEKGGKSNKVDFSFFDTMCYQIGPHAYSLDDIEHGLLRGNRPKPNGKVVIPAGDPRLAMRIETLDPRIHFALVCGAKSCPPVKLYSARNLERGLNMAAKNFVNSEIKVDLTKNTISTNKILHWYTKDFAPTPKGTIKWCLNHAKDELRANLEKALALPDVKIESYDYDWTINAAE